MFCNGTMIKNFLLQLLLKVDDTKYESVPLKTYVEAIRSGKVVLATIIGDQTKQNATAAKSMTPDITKKCPKEVREQQSAMKAISDDVGQIMISMQNTVFKEQKKILRTDLLGLCSRARSRDK